MPASSSSGIPSEEKAMLDLILLVTTVLLFRLAVAYTRRCDRI